MKLYGIYAISFSLSSLLDFFSYLCSRRQFFPDHPGHIFWSVHFSFPESFFSFPPLNLRISLSLPWILRCPSPGIIFFWVLLCNSFSQMYLLDFFSLPDPLGWFRVTVALSILRYLQWWMLSRNHVLCKKIGSSVNSDDVDLRRLKPKSLLCVRCYIPLLDFFFSLMWE